MILIELSFAVQVVSSYQSAIGKLMFSRSTIFDCRGK